jgi:hypothetical protein
VKVTKVIQKIARLALEKPRGCYITTKQRRAQSRRCAWERRSEAERDTRFVELGRYLCEVRAGQYWRLENLKSFDEFLARRFPESRRKAYYLISIHEHLPPQARKELKEVGWTKGLELAKVARRDGQEFDCATWLHKARSLPKDEVTAWDSVGWVIVTVPMNDPRPMGWLSTLTPVPRLPEAKATADEMQPSTDCSPGKLFSPPTMDLPARMNLPNCWFLQALHYFRLSGRAIRVWEVIPANESFNIRK